MKTCTLRCIASKGEARQDIAGRYRSDELEADLLLVSEGGAIYGAFEGFLGKSDMYPLYAAGPDVWLLPVQRSMDAPSPANGSLSSTAMQQAG